MIIPGSSPLWVPAGYSGGLDLEIICSAETADLLSIVKSYWEDVGVNLDIVVHDSGTWKSLALSGEFDDIVMYRTYGLSFLQFSNYVPTSMYNYSNWPEQPLMGWLDKINENWTTPSDQYPYGKEAAVYILGENKQIPMPSPFVYAFWWPWLKSYHGEFSVGFCTRTDTAKYLWIDQDLREEMTGSR